MENAILAAASVPPLRRRIACAIGFQTCAQRLKRASKIDIEICAICGGKMKVIVRFEDPGVIKRFIAHLDSTEIRRNIPSAATTDTARPNGISRRRILMQGR